VAPGIRLVKAQPNVINLSGRDEATGTGTEIFGEIFWDIMEIFSGF